MEIDIPITTKLSKFLFGITFLKNVRKLLRQV